MRLNGIHIAASIICLLFSLKSNAQTKDSTSHFSFTGYADAYYAYYTDSVGHGKYQKFPSVSPRSNEFGLNTLQLTFQYDGPKVRALGTVHYGDIARSTWSGIFNPIMEAHVGLKICKTLWVDAGFFRTHFGTEGLLPKENITSSVSVNTYYEPYYESGIRLCYNPNDKLAINLYLLNSYGMFEDNNDKKSLGTQITYSVTDKINFGYSNYIGDDSPQGDSSTHLRIHQNLFYNQEIKKFKFQIGGDYCLQQNSTIADSKKTAYMYSGVVSLKFQCCKKYALYGRGEIFNDPNGIMTGVITDATNKLTGYNLYGYTFGMEFKPTEHSYIRLEGRKLQMQNNQEIFRWDGENKNYRLEVMTNIGVTF